MLKKIIDGCLIGLGFIIVLSMVCIIGTAAGFHTADEILSGNFKGNFDFTNANVTNLSIATYVEGEETKTGERWTNGKPIYRYIYSGTTPNTASPAEIELTEINNPDEVINWGGTLTTSNDWNAVLPYANDYYDSYLFKKPSTEQVFVRFSGTNYETYWKNQPVKIWVEYTKTTD